MREMNAELMQYIQPVRLKLKGYEIDLIAKALSVLIVEQGTTEYIPQLEYRSRVYRAYRLYKRLFDIRLTPRDEYSITFDRSEIEVVQRSLYFHPGDNMTIQILFGKIHQKTV